MVETSRLFWERKAGYRYYLPLLNVFGLLFGSHISEPENEGEKENTHIEDNATYFYCAQVLPTYSLGAPAEERRQKLT